ncbi:hypothetical protein KQI84_08560 [bacterium]|nr:hypothetical protein [bacterium]
MPYSVLPDDSDYRPYQNLPHHLDHKPILALPYQAFDAFYPRERTDVRWISVGTAQYDPGHISVKTWRHSERRWSRMSEELPLHRVFDAADFAARCISLEGDTLEIPVGTYERQELAIRIQDESESRTSGAMDVMVDFNARHGEMLRRRMRNLLDTLRFLESQGRL